ncbi:MAG: LysM peptidoglycan-binding domain-containing protein [Gammaproteobacteria bacterium]|jgi:hypothetical protein|nr:LysM peptidoglycan-binding domain-containing protein [Gammaproteobacteria bacterium]MDP6616340.1 LysM peptidoglycan-binding domain-containing protein [Gammaproteobacteria bacterium]MDP6695904.1 LysM peptidoglycan-binding domain-containing protein [Gammaproteobacteria bacterium]
MAVAMLQADPAGALSLGDLKVQSAIGQPFSGSATARIGKGESLAPNCVSSMSPGSEIKNADKLRVRVPSTSRPGEYPLEISSVQPMYEPMYEIRLKVDCPGTIAFTRNYIVMLNLPVTNPARQLAPAPEPVAARPAAPAKVATPVAAPVARPATATQPQPAESSAALAPSSGPVAAGESYRVRSGDSLSAIAEKVSGRPVGSTWDVAQQIFDLNPHAFVRGNPDFIKLGAVLKIPGEAMLAEARPGKYSVTADPAVPETVAAGAQPIAAQPLAPETPAPGLIARPEPVRREADVVVQTSELSLPAPEESAPVSEFVTETPMSVEATDLPPTVTSEYSASLDAAEVAPSPFTAPEATVETAVAPVAGEPSELAATEPEESGQSVFKVLSFGALAGLLLAALFVAGRRFLGRESKPTRIFDAVPAPVEDYDGAATTPAAELPESVPVAAEPEADSTATPEPEVEPEPIPVGETVAPAGGVGVSESSAADQSTAVDFDLSTGAATDDTEEDHVQRTADLPTIGDSPRLSLREKADTAPTSHDNTELLNAPEFSEDDAATRVNSELDGTGTMRKLFGQLDATDDDPVDEEAPTEELPDLPSVSEEETMSNLQSLSEEADHGTLNDKMSETLTQALGLLSQDYEDEMTASQILEAEEVEEAFANHVNDKN